MTIERLLELHDIVNTRSYAVPPEESEEYDNLIIEHTKNEKKADMMNKLAPFIDKYIVQLKMKIEIGMGTDRDQNEYKSLQKALPNVLSDLDIKL